MHGLEPLIPIALFLSVAGIIVLRGPIGRALADRIAGRAAQPGRDERRVEALEGLVETLHHRVAELEERQDFAERVMARQDPARLPERN